MTPCQKRRPGSAELLLLDSDSAFTDADLDPRWLLPLLVKLITEGRGGNEEQADNKIKTIAIHHSVSPFKSRRDIFKNNLITAMMH